MYSTEKVNNILEKFQESVENTVGTVNNYGNLYQSMKNNDGGMTKYLVTEIVRVMKALIPAELNQGYTITPYITMSGEDEIRVIDLTIRAKQDDINAKFKKVFTLNEDIFYEIVEFAHSVIVDIIIDEAICQNCSAVNEKLQELCDKAGVDFDITVASPLSIQGKDKKVSKLTDSMIEFIVDGDKVFELEDLMVFANPTELITEDMIEKANDVEVVAIASAQTTPQLIGAYVPLLGYICNISKQVKPSTLIRKVYPKEVSKVTSKEFMLTHKEEDGVYSVVEAKLQDGSVVEGNCVLQPFSIETLERI